MFFDLFTHKMSQMAVHIRRCFDFLFSFHFFLFIFFCFFVFFFFLLLVFVVTIIVCYYFCCCFCVGVFICLFSPGLSVIFVKGGAHIKERQTYKFRGKLGYIQNCPR